ncbi:MAG TPA: DUF3291 domain-containing protein [Thermoleophilaceae bacterium]|jgi:hypothetical protein
MHQIAQLNLARAKAPLDSPELAEFMALLEPINALADGSPGFVWRLQDDDGAGATGIRIADEDRVIVNISVWETIDALWAYVYESAHLEVMRRRREWFVHFGKPFLVLWWVPAGHEPTVAEALERLALLESEGPSPDAFTFKERFAPAAPAPAAS